MPRRIGAPAPFTQPSIGRVGWAGRLDPKAQVVGLSVTKQGARESSESPGSGRCCRSAGGWLRRWLPLGR